MCHESNLLVFPAIMSLELMARVGEAVVNTKKVDIVARYPILFQGLGEPYDIQLKPDPQPHALFTAHNIPLPLRGKVQQELDRMELLGIISSVDAPTPLCAGMVVASTKNGDIRMCGLPTIKSVGSSRSAPQLSGAKVLMPI